MVDAMHLYHQQINTMKISDVKQDLLAANKLVRARANYMCGLTDLKFREDERGYRGFFSSPDRQDSELYYALLKMKYRSSGYNAPYHWKVSKGNIFISYTEGDIGIYQLTK